MRSCVAVLLAVLAALGCDTEPRVQPARWTLWVGDDSPWAVHESAADVETYLAVMGREVERGVGAAPTVCEGGQGHVVFLGDSIAGDVPAGEQSFAIRETRCADGGSRVELAGGDLLGRQYAAYEWLHRLGVRFFHPEQEYVPTEPRWPEGPVRLEHTPAFRRRSVSLHLTHPLELGDAFRLGDPRYLDEAVRYIDWQIKNGASRGHAGIGDGEHATRGLDRGFPLEAGFSLHNQQQGGRPIIDPDDPRSDEEQITEAIDAVMTRGDGRVPDMFGFTFNPSEFTEIDDQVAVRQLTFIADSMRERYPETLVETINHGTAGEPTAHYGVRYYDLPQFAPPNLGVKVHTLMFYDLFRAAPVYGNESFSFLYDWMVQEHTRRAITYFPESAWWLTFDNAVPLYLPITVEARDRDIQGIAWMLDGGLEGHHVFGSGHEWGYWQNEYCSFRMAMDLDYRWQDCFADITGTMGDAGPETQAVLQETVALQEQHLFGREVLAYLVGTDAETEIAASVGIEFHPLPPSPGAMMRWDQARLDGWTADERVALEAVDADYGALLTRLNAVEPMVPEAALPWFAEIRDGIEINMLRARHAWQVYGSLVELRGSQLASDAERRRVAEGLLTDARATTQAAIAVVHRREEGYRYQPLSRSIAGGPDGTEDDNWTIYHYRVHNRAHHGFYYTRIDDLAQAAFEGGADPVVVSDALLGPIEPLRVAIVDPTLIDPVVDWGDGSPTEMGMGPFAHDYPAQDVFTLGVTGTLQSEPYAFGGDVARLRVEHQTGFSGDVVEPAGVDLIEGVMPAIVLGPIDDARIAVGFSGLEDGSVRLDAWTVVAAAPSTDALLETAPGTLEVPVVNRSNGTVTARLSVLDAVVRLEPDGATITIVGQLETEAVIEAVVAIGGFDEAGARRIVASTLGFTPDTLPASVAFRAVYTVR